MAKLFNVNLPDGVSSVKLDSQGRGTVQYTVKNVSSRAIDGRGVLISLPQVKPPSGPVEKGWVKVDGKTDRHFDVDKRKLSQSRLPCHQRVPPATTPFAWTRFGSISPIRAMLGAPFVSPFLNPPMEAVASRSG